MNLRLLQLGDSALPIGGYSQSWGLEAAVDQGRVRDPAGLESWVRSWLRYAVGPCEGVVVASTCRAAAAREWPLVAEANDLLWASLSPPTLRHASRDLGEQLGQDRPGGTAVPDLLAGVQPGRHHQRHLHARGRRVPGPPRGAAAGADCRRRNRLEKKFPPLEVVIVESGGDNLAATFSPELADRHIYVIDVAEGDKIPPKGGPGIQRSDLLVINKTDLAPHVGADLDVMRRDSRNMRGDRPFVLVSLRTGGGVDELLQWVRRQLESRPKTS